MSRNFFFENNDAGGIMPENATKRNGSSVMEHNMMQNTLNLQDG